MTVPQLLIVTTGSQLHKGTGVRIKVTNSNEMQNEVHVLFTGYSYTDPDDTTVMRANCTCTLIRTRHGRNIIVDTMTAWDGARLLDALQQLHGLQPADIHVVVCTHSHSDHIGCNYLFPQAQWHIVSSNSISHGDKYHDFGLGNEGAVFQLDGDDVTLQPTPGHTLSCVSVLVRNTSLGAVVGICGDLFEREEDIANSSIWLEAGSENSQAQRRQRLRMAELCEYIVPGHGAGFAVTQSMRETLRKDLETAKEGVIDR